MSEQDKIQAGARVRLRHDVSRYPHFTAAAGMTGTVVDIGAADVFAVRMDETVPGAEDWENEVHWYPENGDDPSADLEVIPTAGASVRQAVKRQLVVTFDVTGLPEREVDALAGEVAVQAERSSVYTEDGDSDLFGEGHRSVPEPEVTIDPPFDPRSGALVTVGDLEVGKVYVGVSDPGPAFRVEEPMDDEHGPYVLSLDGSGGGYLGIEGSKGTFAEVAVGPLDACAMSTKDRLDAVENAWYELTKGELFVPDQEQETLAEFERLLLEMWAEAEDLIRSFAGDQFDCRTGAEMLGDVDEPVEIPQRIVRALSLLHYGRAT